MGDNEAKQLYNRNYWTNNKENISNIQKLWYDANREKILNDKKEYYQRKKEEISKAKKEYYQLNKDAVDKRKKAYYENNKEKVKKRKNEYNKERIKVDPLYKLIRNTRSLIGNSIRKNGYRKSSKTFEILGCTFEQFKEHLESQFESWMNWDNYGLYNGELNYGWDIDHIIPSSSALTVEDIVGLNNYTNLQPLCSKVNRDEKRAK